MKDDIHWNDSIARWLTDRLYRFFHMHFRYDEANARYRQIAKLIDASISADEQRTPERVAMEILEAQKDLFDNRFAEESQSIFDSCAVTPMKLEDLTTEQGEHRLLGRRVDLHEARVSFILQHQSGDYRVDHGNHDRMPWC